MAAPFLVCCQCFERFVKLGLRKIVEKRISCPYSTKRQSKWQPVVGLEIHAQLLSNSKLFSGSSSKYGAPTNTQVSFFDVALPGTLPVLNYRCVEAGVITALALGCTINLVSSFDRKHYFYSDLPAGYQITQYRHPLASGGQVNYMVSTHKSVQQTAQLIQLQLEIDSGKSLHDTENSLSLIDLNRSGVGLMEIITAPNFTSGSDAAAFIRELQLILQTVGTCNGKMAEGSLRVDSNISVYEPGKPLGVRTEVKNLNSIRSVAKAIDYEIARQMMELDSGGVIVNETRAYDVNSSETVPLRDKEQLQDYRYMAEPNLPPIHIYDNQNLPPPHLDSSQIINVDVLRARLPELPEDKRIRLQQMYGLPLSTVNTLILQPGLLSIFEKVASSQWRDARVVANFLMNDFLDLVYSYNFTADSSPIPLPAIGELFDMFQSGSISMETARKVLAEMLAGSEEDPKEIVQSKSWSQIQDRDHLVHICEHILTNNPKAVDQYKKGKKKVINSFMGQVLKSSDGRANPKMVLDLLKELLS